MQAPIEIPLEKLSTEILDALVEEFILREGTDYGAQEVSLGQKKEQVLKQLKNNKVKIVFDVDSETATLITVQEFSKL